MDTWTPRLHKLADQFSVPVVNLIESEDPLPFPTVSADNREVGRMAFERLRSLGLSYYAYLQCEAAPDDKLRRQGFEDAVRAAGMGASLVQVSNLLSRSDWGSDLVQQAEVLRELPRPIGLFCFADGLARFALQALHLADVHVPGNVAVMGADDDEILCETATPSLTSIDTHKDRIGYEAAKLATEMASIDESGRPVDPIHKRIAPLGVIERMSTHVLATDDTDVAEALRMISWHVNEDVSLTAERIAKQIIVSRRGLDKSFTRSLGHICPKNLTANGCVGSCTGCNTPT